VLEVFGERIVVQVEMTQPVGEPGRNGGSVGSVVLDVPTKADVIPTSLLVNCAAGSTGRGVPPTASRAELPVGTSPIPPTQHAI